MGLSRFVALIRRRVWAIQDQLEQSLIAPFELVRLKLFDLYWTLSRLGEVGVTPPTTLDDDLSCGRKVINSFR